MKQSSGGASSEQDEIKHIEDTQLTENSTTYVDFNANIAESMINQTIETETKSITRTLLSPKTRKRVTFSSHVEEQEKINFNCIGCNTSNSSCLREGSCVNSNNDEDKLEINSILFQTNSSPEKGSVFAHMFKWLFICSSVETTNLGNNKDKSKSKEVWGSGVLYDNFLEQIIQPQLLLKRSRSALKKIKVKHAFKNISVEFNSLEEALDSENVFQWTSFQVCSWLKLIGLEKYTGTFLVNAVDGSTLLELSRSHFKLGLGVNDEDHLTSLQVGICLLLSARKGKYAKSTFFNDWSLNKTLSWCDRRGFGILKDRLRERAVHGGVLLFVNLDYLIEKVISIRTITNSSVIIASLKASILRERNIESSLHKQLYQNKRRSASFLESEVLSWGLAEVEEWLKSVNIGHKIGNFRQHCVNGTILLDLDYKMMREMGLSEILSIVLVKALNHLRRDKVALKRKNSTSIPSQDTPTEEFLSFNQYIEEFKLDLEVLREATAATNLSLGQSSPTLSEDSETLEIV